jgi:hypothetical protein
MELGPTILICLFAVICCSEAAVGVSEWRNWIGKGLIALLVVQLAWLVGCLRLAQWLAERYDSDPGLDGLAAIALLITGEAFLLLPGVALILAVGLATGNSAEPTA